MNISLTYNKCKLGKSNKTLGKVLIFALFISLY